MTQANAPSKKRRPLDELHWFSFQDSFGQGPDQIVDEDVYAQYLSAINDVEHELVRELGLHHFAKSAVVPVPSEIDEYIRYANATLHELESNEIDEWLSMLDQHRHDAIEHLALPATLYTLLCREIDKSRSDIATPLTIKEHKSKRLAYGLVQFSTKSLDSWDAVNTLISLDLGTSLPTAAKRRPREELTHNRDKTIGLLVHILAELFPTDLKTEGKPKRVVISRIEELVRENIKPDKADSYPRRSKLMEILRDGCVMITDDDVIDARSPLQIPKGQKALGKHYQAILATVQCVPGNT
jgi:hypothetical protein